ncbi:unnamed protein product [Paramecium sonneborni]|uniref:Transmembrane protein n=1 Tax=Paramecium sonneborni TaxID=65129 RepID=A0A8S1RQH1_9CILI|nr:unnamed protein product [Paramecium sonneborni]
MDARKISIMLILLNISAQESEAVENFVRNTQIFIKRQKINLIKQTLIIIIRSKIPRLFNKKQNQKRLIKQKMILSKQKVFDTKNIESIINKIIWKFFKSSLSTSQIINSTLIL